MNNATLLAGALCLAASSSAQGASRREPLILQPTSEWVLDYAPERCTLLREYGENDQKLKLRVDSFGSWVSFRVTVSGKLVPKSFGPVGDLSVRLTHDERERARRAFFGKAGSQPAAFFGLDFVPLEWLKYDEGAEERTLPDYLSDPALKEFERNTTDMLIEFASGKKVDLRFSEMSRPLKALRDCIDNLHQAWGLDPDREKLLSKRARPTDQTVKAMQRHFPNDMVWSGRNGYIPVRIMVDAQGNGSDCVVQTDKVEESFREAVCEGLSKTFEPALDQSGTPVASVFRTAVIYLIG
ncbi:hypothetical protein [Altererythrobacter sp. Root672]|uniref:hypothetical protein n=1 Tax=Altererythrobacter sp. Root672 TaxID=1736584 RepID=UPI0007000CCA|nr:hypothetical protein [Altererythrobacter sp. Root672]KRA81492.1 hypothetical protein ASD76_13185 [Altererythrobacter sp. Root672]